MGHGASVDKSQEFNLLFCNKESLDGNRCMADDDFARAFVYFIRYGGWKDSYSTYFQGEEYMTVSLDQLARGNICILHNYLLPRNRIEEFLFIPMSPVKQEERIVETEISSVRSVAPHIEGVVLNSIALEEQKIKCFLPSEYAGILFSALYTMFWSITDCESLADLCSYGGTIEDNYGFHFDESKPTPTTERRQRSAELMAEIVNDFSDAELLRELQTTRWARDSWKAFETSRLCIAIVDTLTPSFPFVYANTSFLRLTKYKLQSLCYTPFDTLFGKETEPLLSAVLLEAITQSKSARVSVTLYNRRRKAHVYLVSVKAAGRYSVLNFITTENLLHEKELKMADDVLCLLTCVVKNPPPVATLRKHTSRRRRSVVNHHFAALSPPQGDETAEQG